MVDGRIDPPSLSPSAVRPSSDWARVAPAAAAAEITGSVCLAAALPGEAACFNLTYLRRDRRTDGRTGGRTHLYLRSPLRRRRRAAEEEEAAAA